MKWLKNEVKQTNQASEDVEECMKFSKNVELNEKKNEALQLCPVTEGTEEKSNGSEQSITLNWVNEMLGRSYSFLPKYKSYSEFKDGKALKSLLSLQAGHDPDWYDHNNDPWSDIDMFLSGLEYDFDISALKRGRKEDIIKFVNWIREDVEHEVETRKYDD